MLSIVLEPNKLQTYQTQFIRELERARTGRIPCSISWRPASVQREVNYLANVDIWYHSEELKNRWWNVFGIGQPRSGDSVRITCEINIPRLGIGLNMAGAFAEDGAKVFVVHRGNRYGGGKEGMTKAYFWANYSGHWQIAMDGSKVAIIGELGNPQLPTDVANFVRWKSRL